MKKMRTLARKWFRLTGRTLAILWFAIPAHAQLNMPTPSELSGRGVDTSTTVTDAQRNMALCILKTAMAILRDDEPFDAAHTIFGDNFAVKPKGSNGMKLSFENPVFPHAQIDLYVRQDPADDSPDRRNVRQAPTAITIRLSPLIPEISRSTLEEMFPLDIGYWVDGNGIRQPGNDVGVAPPRVLLHRYRYRASKQPASRFPVDVELTFGDPDPLSSNEDEPKTPVFMGVILNRAYSKATL